METIELEIERVSEAERVVKWRREELENAGYGRAAADLLSGLRYVDLHVATKLLRDGCPPSTALEILL